MKDNQLHLKHERLTQEIYDDGNMLPSRYALILTNLCNLHCDFCFQAKKHHPNSMTTQEWLKTIDQFPEYARVTMTGGEPLLFNGFKEVFHAVASRFDCNIITNGLLLTKEIIDTLLSYEKFQTLSISIDTVKNTNRGVKPDEWEHVEDMMRYFVTKRDALKSSCKLDVKTTVLDENSADLLTIHRYCLEDLGADFHSYQLLKGSPLQHSDVMSEFDDIFRPYRAHEYQHFDLISEQFSAVRSYNIKNDAIGFTHPKVTSLTQEDDTNYNYINQALHDPKLFETCKYPWSSVHINYDGHLFPCLSVSMGNVKTTKLESIIFSDTFNNFKDQIKAHGTVAACNRCGWLKPKEST